MLGSFVRTRFCSSVPALDVSPAMSHANSFAPLFVPPVGRQHSALVSLVQPLELRTGSCSTPGCPFDGHPLHGGKCSACGQGWSPERLEQLRSLAEAADADTRARAFVDWDEPGVTLAPGRYEKLRRAVERWASNNTSSSVAPSVSSTRFSSSNCWPFGSRTARNCAWARLREVAQGESCNVHQPTRPPGHNCVRGPQPRKPGLGDRRDGDEAGRGLML